MSVVLPLHIDFKQWASQMKISFPSVNLPNPPSVESWQEWAAQVIVSNALVNVPLPSRICYPNAEDWRTWGAYFINSVYNQS
jgi:hypothetical protein